MREMLDINFDDNDNDRRCWQARAIIGLSHAPDPIEKKKKKKEKKEKKRKKKICRNSQN